jgi:hypothetical protein
VTGHKAAGFQGVYQKFADARLVVDHQDTVLVQDSCLLSRWPAPVRAQRREGAARFSTPTLPSLMPPLPVRFLRDPVWIDVAWIKKRVKSIRQDDNANIMSNPDISEIEQAQAILHRKGSCIAIVKDLVDRQRLLENVGAGFLSGIGKRLKFVHISRLH